VNRKMQVDILAKLEIATAKLHENINNFEKQGKLNRLNEIIENIKIRRVERAVLRSRIKWQQVGDKCSKEFFRLVRLKNIQAAISEFKDRQCRCFTKKEELEKITKNFYEVLYGHKDISEDALTKAMEGVLATFTNVINEALRKEITENELHEAVNSMAKGKAPVHDGVPVEFFQTMWPTIGKDFHLMIKKNIEDKQLHEGVTKGLICLIPKENDVKDLNYWKPITLLTVTHKIFVKALQIRLQLMPGDVISPEQTVF